MWYERIKNRRVDSDILSEYGHRPTSKRSMFRRSEPFSLREDDELEPTRTHRGLPEVRIWASSSNVDTSCTPNVSKQVITIPIKGDGNTWEINTLLHERMDCTLRKGYLGDSLAQLASFFLSPPLLARPPLQCTRGTFLAHGHMKSASFMSTHWGWIAFSGHDQNDESYITPMV